MKLSEHFTLEEMIFSATAESKGIDNTPKGQDLENLKYTCSQLELVRNILGGNSINVSSGYRGEKLNAAVGGVSTSAHNKGLAADFTCKAYGDTRKIVKALLEASRVGQLSFDQLILEMPDTPNSWIHIGFKQHGQGMRNQILTMKKVNNKSTYFNGIV